MDKAGKNYHQILTVVRWAAAGFVAAFLYINNYPEGNPLIKQVSAREFLIALLAVTVLQTILSFAIRREGSAKAVCMGLIDLLVASAGLLAFGRPEFLLLFTLPILDLGVSGRGGAFLTFLFVSGTYAILMTLYYAGYTDKIHFLQDQELGILYAFTLVVFLLSLVGGYLYDSVRAQARQTKSLLGVIEASQQLGATTSLESVLATVVSMVQALFKCHTVVVHLQDNENSEAPVLRVQAKSTAYGNAFTDFNPEVAASYFGKAMKNRAAVYVPDLSKAVDEDVLPKNKAFQSLLVAPLMFEGHAMGAITIISGTPNAYNEDTQKLFAMLGSQIALAVRNVQLQQSTLTLAITDSLSGLFTHGYFQEHLSKEIIKAKYASQPTSVMIIDVDFFKKVNDTYGHPQGDSLLRQLGAVIKTVTRPNDIVCRYGGDEFTITMLNTNRIGAVLIAERIRTSVEEYEFVLGPQIVHISVSGGVASFPEDAGTKKEIVEKADAALYEAKHKGRNKICFAA